MPLAFIILRARARAATIRSSDVSSADQSLPTWQRHHDPVEFLPGKKRHTITRQGARHFLEQTFETVQSAGDFCFAELRTDPAAIWYIIEGDSIVQTVLDHAFQKEQEWKRARKYAFFSPLVFAVISSLVVTITSPFESAQANVGLVAIIDICYVLLLLMFGTRNLEAAILMTLILILLCMLIPALKRAKERSEKARHSLVIPALSQCRARLC